jgi:phosphonate degradation associated HDIG domain protein
MTQSDPWPLVERLFRESGSDAYFGEAVTQLQHALQSAALAEAEGATDSLVVAALLHDIGHLLHGFEQDIADKGVDGNHEAVGAQFLEQAFPASVSEPARGHVDAKRYLCAVDPDYRATLSPASVKSLELQGGVMNPAQCLEFESRPYFTQTVRLRRWDDRAKAPDAVVPGIEAYRDRIRACAR